MNTHQQLDDDTTTLILVGLLGGPAVLAAAVGIAASRTPAAAAWLVEHHVLASAAATPVLPIPGAGGAGLDWARIIPVVSLLIIAVVWGVWLARNKPTPRGGAK